MRTETPPAVKLAEYTSYPFAIDSVALVFDLQPDATIVSAELSVRRTGSSEADLVLDGQAMELLSIAIDDRTLEESEYALSESELRIPSAPGAFKLRTKVRIDPSGNTALSGLYMSGGRFCTQCEAEGFRRITYWPDRPDVMSRFSVHIEADKANYPILLSNGSPTAAGDLDGGRHYAAWDDPHLKPSYLFALCAGDYDVFEDAFTTASGRPVRLAIHVDKGDRDRAAWAMDCLKRSMRWDEDVFGREYDLDVFNIVAVRDFNFGAMENKGLNIFNSAYVLADEATATDADFEAIESIVAHEYFHNWTGNRITCRDWFQLCLKEGLTVFRDQEFSADQRSRSVQRIKDVIRLRARQFAEDAGPLAHPVRPDAYASIDNLYTATVYEKGAELIRVLKRYIGDDAFAKGMSSYFERFDGTAATIEDFYSCFEDASGRDLAPFRIWYAQAGTPLVTAQEHWDPDAARLRINFQQITPPTPGQDHKQPVVIPLACALLDGDGGHLAADDWPDGERLIVLEDAATSVEVQLSSGSKRPTLSINRGFTAPIRLHRDLSNADRIRYAVAETDPFSRWDALQNLAFEDLIRTSGGGAPDASLVEAFANAAMNAVDDPAYAALLLRLPDVGELFLAQDPADAAALKGARNRFREALALQCAPLIERTLAEPAPAPFSADAAQTGVRALRGAAIGLLSAQGASKADALADLFGSAPDMTESLAALRALCAIPGPQRDDAIAQFYDRWRSNQLVLDKWFAVQSAFAETADDIDRLMAHADFDVSNPNRVRAVIGVFAMQNLAVFHAPEGRGHRLLSEACASIDKSNPALAARLLTAFEQWRRLPEPARTSAAKALEDLRSADLSSNSADIVARSLG